ncbi:hypothetical protein [Spirochaeta isovalerica]|uniref:Uncharacterized protein n=1 Tax=Spirochaeta isovalerica TaxID=150 RepID=A0A841RAM2_9SPIO|nr:hypothetical protein [Spirochaeta isovalerica]MBB6479482.1 hypothetical protein [Spirochaeta isovalerica]
MRLNGSGFNLGYSQVATAQRTGIGLPVSSNSVIYSYYKHVHGYSAGENSPTVPISKIRILNNLIENLSRLKGDASLKNSISGADKMSSEAVGRLIDSYSKELHRVVSAAQTGFNVSETGMVVSLTA